ncbi:glycosyltransferase family 2 protein [Helicobacter sp. 16-1353]|uniref:glycosyltransferase family 2 protein n=1 Tax=Helicobacter sp. 16-1353 TaxID=2004996 RepID=UPI0015EE4464|nr:glycosyltransferase family 2 protein [Helicobacter sp. 16-1353]
MKKLDLSLSIIVPCFNEEANVNLFYTTLLKVLGESPKDSADSAKSSSLKSQDSTDSKRADSADSISQDSIESALLAKIATDSQKAKKPKRPKLNLLKNYEIIFVDDGSTDKTIDKIRALQKKDKNIRLIKFSRNFGKEAAMLAGLKAAKNTLSFIMDCDLQDPPELLCTMIEKYINSNGALKIITAKRKDRSGDSKLRAVFTEMFYKVNNLISPIKLQSGVRDFRLLHRDALQSILSMNEYHRFSKAIFEFVGFPKEVVEYDYIERNEGESKWNFWKLFVYAIGGIVSFSTVPLKIITYVGIVIFALSSLYGAWTIINTLIFGNPVKGYPSIVTLIAFFGGLQIILLGVIGEYIARIYEQSKGRPHYFIEYED